MKAAERRELRHDKFVDGVVSYWTRAKTLLSPYRRWFYWAGGVVAGAVVIALIFWAVGESRTRSAWAAMHEEQQKEQNGLGQADYEKLSKEYAGTGAEPWVLFEWAQQTIGKTPASESKGKAAQLDQAIQALEKVRTLVHPDHLLADRATLLIAQQQLNKEAWAEAEACYRALIEKRAATLDPFVLQEARFWRAYALEALNRVSEATEIYTGLVKEKTMWGDNARFRLGRIKAAGG